MLLESTTSQAANYSDLFTIARPGHLSLTVSGEGYGSDAFDSTYEGFEFEQSTNRFLGLIARISIYQVYHGDGFNTPFPFGDTDKFARGTPRNFGRFEGGIDLLPFQGTNIAILAGRDVGDSRTPMIEGDFSTWIRLHSPHPINFSSNLVCYFQHETRNTSRLDLRTIAFSTGRLMLILGAGGAIWGGGGSDLQGQAGPDIGVFLNTWRTNVDLQIGYGGNPHTYGLISISKHFGWDE
jgi:hypothetical protein